MARALVPSRRPSPVDTQATTAQPVKSSEALVAAVAAPEPDKNRRRRRDAPFVAGHEYAIPATGTVNYACTTATGEP